jgi:hypothetical protein
VEAVSIAAESPNDRPTPPRRPACSKHARVTIKLSALNNPTTDDVVWGIDSRFAMLVVRQDATVEADRSVYFTSDRTRPTSDPPRHLRLHQPASLVKITTSA